MIPFFEEGFDLQLRRDVKVSLPFNIGHQTMHTVVIANEGTKVRTISKLLWLSRVCVHNRCSLHHIEELVADPVMDDLPNFQISHGS